MTQSMKGEGEAGLYVIATPLGHLGDLTLRAQAVLRSVDAILAEDTRNTRVLLTHYEIENTLVRLDEHEEYRVAAQWIERLQSGGAVALVSDAGTPLISDPGAHLVALAHQKGVRVIPIPGPCALIAALSVSGIGANSFVFEGFLPPKANSRRPKIEALIAESRTLIFYESPHRFDALLADLISAFGPERRATLCRELTKKFETVHLSTLGELKAQSVEQDMRWKGEIVLIVEGAPENQFLVHALEIYRVFDLLQEAGHSDKEAIRLTAAVTQASKNQVYEWILERKKR